MMTSKSATPSQAAPARLVAPSNDASNRTSNAVTANLRALAIMALAYWMSAVSGAWLSPPGAYVSFWLPAGVYVTALLVRSRREWPWLAMGAFLGNLAFDVSRGTPFVLFCGFHAANVVQAFSGACLVRRFVGSPPRLDSLRSFFWLVALAALAAQALGAFIGASTLFGAGYAPSFWIPFCVWWGSCALASLSVLSVALSWMARNDSATTANLRSAWWEFALICVLILGGTWVLFAMDAGALAPHKFILLPLLLWSGVRFGVRGASLACLLLVVVCTYLTNHFQVDPLGAGDEVARYVFTLQAYLATSTVVALLPAITLAERDQSLATLRDSEDRYRTLVDAAFEGIAITEAGVVQDANDQLLQMLQCSRAELVGRAITQFVAPESRALVVDPGASSRAQSVECLLRRNDGAMFHAEVQARMVRQAGRMLRIMAIRDVTVRREAEAAMKAGEEVLRLFIEHAPAAIAMLDTEMRYLRHSQRWLTDYHLEGQNLIGRSHYELFPDIPERWKEVHRRVVSGAIEYCSEDQFPRTSGKVEWIQWEARPWRQADGGIGGLIFFTQVVTERKEAEARQSTLEAQLRQAQKLDAVGTLAGGIAHDFNNILGSISAHAELAKLDAPAGSDSDLNLKGVLKATRRASKLVQQILTFSRSQPQERVVMRLEPVVLEALELLRSTLPSSIEFVHRVNGDVPAVCANSTHMHQVLVNLCTNAAHAMRGRTGQLTVTVDLYPLGAQEALGLRIPPGHYVRLTVSDNGDGMSEDVVPRIFDPFFTTKSQHGGTGLGLAVVHGIVLEHEGAISVESRVGHGSTFRVLLPATSERVPEAAANELTARSGGGERLLLVDDEKQLATGTAKLLGRFGYSVTVFERPSDAWVEFAREPRAYDLVITDLTMPEMDGIELSRRILELRPDCPVLLTTGSFNDATQRAAVAIGIRQVLLKPVEHRVLLQAISTQLNSKLTSSGATASLAGS
jgi:PAS domain S-box-containing protein